MLGGVRALAAMGARVNRNKADKSIRRPLGSAVDAARNTH